MLVKRLFIFISIMLSIISIASCQPTPKNHWEQILKNGKIVVGTSADYSPFEYVDKNGDFAGFDIDVVREMAARLGLDVEIIDMPFDGLINAVQKGKIDLAIAAFNYSEDRDQVVDFTEAYYYQENGFLVSNDFSGDIDVPEDAARYRLGVQTGSMADAWATSTLLDHGLIPTDDLYHYDRVDQAALDIMNGRIDVLMADYYPLLTIETEYEGLKIIYHGEVAAGPMMMIVPNDGIEFKLALDEVITEMIQDGFIDKVATEHFSRIK
jgi:polar amino acid transport system substrate-binding protein